MRDMGRKNDVNLMWINRNFYPWWFKYWLWAEVKGKKDYNYLPILKKNDVMGRKSKNWRKSPAVRTEPCRQPSKQVCSRKRQFTGGKHERTVINRWYYKHHSLRIILVICCIKQTRILSSAWRRRWYVHQIASENDCFLCSWNCSCGDRSSVYNYLNKNLRKRT